MQRGHVNKLKIRAGEAVEAVVVFQQEVKRIVRRSKRGGIDVVGEAARVGINVVLVQAAEHRLGRRRAAEMRRPALQRRRGDAAVLVHEVDGFAADKRLRESTAVNAGHRIIRRKDAGGIQAVLPADRQQPARAQHAQAFAVRRENAVVKIQLSVERGHAAGGRLRRPAFTRRAGGGIVGINMCFGAQGIAQIEHTRTRVGAQAIDAAAGFEQQRRGPLLQKLGAEQAVERKIVDFPAVHDGVVHPCGEREGADLGLLLGQQLGAVEDGIRILMEQQQPRALQRPRLDRRGKEDGALDRREVAGGMDADAGHALQIRQKRPVRLIEDGAQTGVFQIGFGYARLQRERNRLRALAVGRAEDERVRAGGGDDGLPRNRRPVEHGAAGPGKAELHGVVVHAAVGHAEDGGQREAGLEPVLGAVAARTRQEKDMAAVGSDGFAREVGEAVQRGGAAAERDGGVAVVFLIGIAEGCGVHRKSDRARLTARRQRQTVRAALIHRVAAHDRLAVQHRRSAAEGDGHAREIGRAVRDAERHRPVGNGEQLRHR